MALTVTATVEPNNVPPRVKIDVADIGSTTAITSVVVTRTDAAGNLLTVRTESGAPLALALFGDDRLGTVYDYEVPFGVPVTYSTTQDPTVTSATVTVDEGRVWLIHPGIPARSVPIDLLRGSLDEEQEDVAAGVFFPLGRRNAVTITDGRRKAPSSELVVGTVTPAERTALRTLLSDAFPLLLNVPPMTGLGVDTAYIHIAASRMARRSDIGEDQGRRWTLPFQVVDMPVGGSQSQRTWVDVIDGSATWQDLIDTFPTWADVQAPTT